MRFFSVIMMFLLTLSSVYAQESNAQKLQKVNANIQNLLQSQGYLQKKKEKLKNMVDVNFGLGFGYFGVACKEDCFIGGTFVPKGMAIADGQYSSKYLNLSYKRILWNSVYASLGYERHIGSKQKLNFKYSSTSKTEYDGNMNAFNFALGVFRDGGMFNSAMEIGMAKYNFSGLFPDWKYTKDQATSIRISPYVLYKVYDNYYLSLGARLEYLWFESPEKDLLRAYEYIYGLNLGLAYRF